MHLHAHLVAVGPATKRRRKEEPTEVAEYHREITVRVRTWVDLLLAPRVVHLAPTVTVSHIVYCHTCGLRVTAASRWEHQLSECPSLRRPCRAAGCSVLTAGGGTCGGTCFERCCEETALRAEGKLAWPDHHDGHGAEECARRVRAAFCRQRLNLLDTQQDLSPLDAPAGCVDHLANRWVAAVAAGDEVRPTVEQLLAALEYLLLAAPGLVAGNLPLASSVTRMASRLGAALLAHLAVAPLAVLPAALVAICACPPTGRLHRLYGLLCALRSAVHRGTVGKARPAVVAAQELVAQLLHLTTWRHLREVCQHSLEQAASDLADAEALVRTLDHPPHSRHRRRPAGTDEDMRVHRMAILRRGLPARRRQIATHTAACRSEAWCGREKLLLPRLVHSALAALDTMAHECLSLVPPDCRGGDGAERLILLAAVDFLQGEIRGVEGSGGGEAARLFSTDPLATILTDLTKAFYLPFFEWPSSK